jgi:hypothetical protein
MSGGTISGNTAAIDGGGVYVEEYFGYFGTFTKTAAAGIIYGYDAQPNQQNTAASGIGHAVYVADGPKKRDATAGTGVALDSAKTGILGGWEDFTSAAIQEAIDGLGSGETLVLPGGTYDMEGPTVEVSDNIIITTEPGAEVILMRNPTIPFTDDMIKVTAGGLILQAGTGGSLALDGNGDSVFAAGSLVRVESGNLTITDGVTLENNNSSSFGGGVYFNSSGTFAMNGGTISGNNAVNGGGVYVESGTFKKKNTDTPGDSGVIYGKYEAGTTNPEVEALKNTASSDNDGHAVYVQSISEKRNSTADVGDDLDSTVSGLAGGWE